MISEQYLPIAGGGIVYDGALVRNPDPAIFTRDYWMQRSALNELAGGRGSVCVLRTDEGEWIWRHYRRGGVVARVSNDLYAWRGADATRSFREWRLLAMLVEQNLPVPAPVAARYERRGLVYRADIITSRIPNALTLVQTLQRDAVPTATWEAIGATIARFHAAGVHHADLNAHNILLADGKVHLLDFDRGRIRARGAWEAQVIARLKRSLDKEKGKHPALQFEEADWDALGRGLGRVIK